MLDNQEGTIVDEETTDLTDAPAEQEHLDTEPASESKSGKKASFDDLYEDAMASLGIGTEGRKPKAEAAPAESEETEQPEEGTPAKSLEITHDQDVVLVDKDGQKYKLQDVLWRTENYHRKLAEVDNEVKAYKALDKQYRTDPVGLVKQILTAKAPELAQAFEHVLGAAQKHGVYDPMAVKAAQLEFEREEFTRERSQVETERQIEAARASVVQDVRSLESTLGRSLSASETKAMAKVLSMWGQKRRVDPEEPLPNIREVYDLAVNLTTLESLKRGKEQSRKPSTTPERPTAAQKKAAKPSVDELFDKAMQSWGIK